LMRAQTCLLPMASRGTATRPRTRQGGRAKEEGCLPLCGPPSVCCTVVSWQFLPPRAECKLACLGVLC
jgi:hypothetical protein